MWEVTPTTAYRAKDRGHACFKLLNIYYCLVIGMINAHKERYVTITIIPGVFLTTYTNKDKINVLFN